MSCRSLLQVIFPTQGSKPGLLHCRWVLYQLSYQGIHGTMDWFQIGKGVCQGCILSPCLFNLYAKYIMQNAGLDKAQAGIKTAGRNVGNLIYADDTTLNGRK